MNKILSAREQKLLNDVKRARRTPMFIKQHRLNKALKNVAKAFEVKQ